MTKKENQSDLQHEFFLLKQQNQKEGKLNRIEVILRLCSVKNSVIDLSVPTKSCFVKNSIISEVVILQVSTT